MMVRQYLTGVPDEDPEISGKPKQVPKAWAKTHE